jgi:hypothetical protein
LGPHGVGTHGLSTTVGDVGSATKV